MTDSELVTLYQIVKDQGYDPDVLTSTVKNAVIQVYRERYPDRPDDVSVLFDTQTGDIRLLSHGKDITPDDFSNRIAEAARKDLLKLIARDSTPKTKHSSAHVRGTGTLLKLIFFGYNGLFIFYLAFFIIGMISTEFRQSVLAAISGRGTFGALMLLVAGLTPFVTTITSLRRKLHHRVGLLTRLFFIFELPTVTGALILYAVFNYPIPAFWLVASTFLTLPFLIFLKTADITPQDEKSILASFITKEVVFLLTGYFVLLYSFYFPLFITTIGSLLSELLGSIVSPYSGSIDIVYIILALPFGLLGILLLFGLSFIPYVAFMLITRSLNADRKPAKKILGTQGYQWTTIGVFLGVVATILAAGYQPNTEALLTNLKQFNSANTFDQKEQFARVLVPRHDTIKQAVLDVGNDRNRYPIDQDSDGLAFGYEHDLSFPIPVANFIQKSFQTLAFPFVYRGPNMDRYALRNAYKALFGKSISEDTYGHRIEQKQVKLVERRVEARTDYRGLLAEVSIQEEFTNQAWNEQEVIYEFSLPHETVITDLKLGPQLEYDGVIAPRGAAQETYERQLRRNRDPALLEQTGPSQYRLRIFPIPSRNDSTALDGRNQRVKFTYITASTPDGYPLPIYTKTDNINVDRSVISYKLDDSTVSPTGNDRFLPSSGKPFADPCTLDETITAGSDADLIIRAHHQDPTISQLSPCRIGDPTDLPGELKGKQIVLFYDVSYQNRHDQFPARLTKIIDHNPEFFIDNQVTLYPFNNQVSHTARLLKPTTYQEALDLVYFGHQHIQQLLTEAPLDNDFAYNEDPDLAILIAAPADEDESSLLNISEKTNPPNYPLYIISPDSNVTFKRSFSDYLIRSDGRVVKSLPEALRSYAITAELEKADRPPLFITPYWSIAGDPGVLAQAHSGVRIDAPAEPVLDQEHSPTTAPNKARVPGVDTIEILPITPPDDPLQRLAAKGEILNLITTYRNDLSENLTQLDRIDQLARQNRVVTPYSSFIALVNEDQMHQLRREIQDRSRYEVSDDESTAFDSGPGLFPEEYATFSNIDSILGLDLGFLGTGVTSGGIRESAGNAARNSDTQPSRAASAPAASLPFVGLLAVGSILLVGVSFLVFIFITIKTRLRK